MDINTTKIINSDVDHHYLEFINTINDILPIEIEEYYFKLANKLNQILILLDKYYNFEKRTQFYNAKVHDLLLEIYDFENKKRQMVEVNNTIDNSIKLETKRGNTYSVEIWNCYKQNLEKAISEMDKLINKYKTDKQELMLNINKSIFDKQDFSKLSNLKKEIYDLLLNIRSLNVDGNKFYLSNIYLPVREVVKIRNYEIDNSSKIILEDVISTYISVRVEIFKLLETMTVKSVNNMYSDKNLFNDDLDKFNLAMSVLSNIDLTDKTFDVTNVDTLTNNEDYIMQSKILKILKRYYKGYFINAKDIDLYNYNKKSKYSEIINNLKKVLSKNDVKGSKVL